MDYSLPGSSAHEIFQARTLDWGAISSSGNLPGPGIEPTSLASPALAGGLFATEPPGKPTKLHEMVYRFADSKQHTFL